MMSTKEETYNKSFTPNCVRILINPFMHHVMIYATYQMFLYNIWWSFPLSKIYFIAATLCFQKDHCAFPPADYTEAHTSLNNK